MNSVIGMASSCFACCIFHIISIKFNYSDTAISVAKAMVGAKVISLCFAMVWFSKFAPVTLRGLLSSRKRGWNYLYEPKTKLVPVTVPCEEVPNCIEVEKLLLWLLWTSLTIKSSSRSSLMVFIYSFISLLLKRDNKITSSQLAY